MTAEAAERELAAASPGAGPRAQPSMRADHNASQESAIPEIRHKADPGNPPIGQ